MQPMLFITGASKGIGKAIANKFAEHHWHIVNVSRSNYAAPNAINTSAININCDLTDLESLAAIKPFIASLDTPRQICVVHNAAMLFNDSIKQPDLAQLSQSLTLSLLAPALINQLLIPKMATNSSIIYMGSTLSEKAVANAMSYVTCKHAVVGLMRATCQDLASNPIHTCCICPGFTDTEMLHTRASTPEQLAELYEFAKSKVGAHRLIDPAEIAELTYFCATNPVINGAVLHANLGQLEN